jgi:GTP-binding protein HflX
VKNAQQFIPPEASQEELAQLAASAGVEIAGRVIQHLPAPNNTFYVGKGKLEDLKAEREKLGFSTIIFDDELTPGQQRNLEEALEVKIIDRVALILDIFARRARTREGRLQVELAQHQYLLPRLAGQWSHLERLGGGIGTRGPGESQLETDRRLIRKRIQRLEDQIEKVMTQRLLYRERRLQSGIPMVALVGYTNAGKSTLLNALSHAGVTSENKLFTTLDPTTRRVRLPNGQTILLSDTVGFIRKLPPTIVSAFRATLEELSDASLLLNVVDFSSKFAAEESQTVEDILKKLELLEKPRITVLNKIDNLLDINKEWDENKAFAFFKTAGVKPDKHTVMTAASKGWGLTRLLDKIAKKLSA